ncbi:MAG: hypothetical protein J7K95_01565 [Thermoplasmata archaeon]|nr:hypothetical protein [Thermoplasmata archaeon]
MSYTGWFLVELYYMMKRFGKKRIGKIVNSTIAVLLFIFAFYIFMKTVVLI